MKRSDLIIWGGGGGSGSFVLNLANCLKAHRDEKETANLIKNSRYAFWY